MKRPTNQPQSRKEKSRPERQKETAKSYPMTTTANIEVACDTAATAIKSAVRYDPLNLVRGGRNGSLGLKIQDKHQRLVTLRLSYTQERLLRVVEVLRRRRIPIRIHALKSRQVYFSTAVQAIMYAIASQTENVRGVTIADDVKGSVYLFEKEKLMQDELRKDLPFLVEPTKKNNEQALEWETLGSSMMVDTARNPRAGRKYTFHMVHLSESAFFPDYDSLMGGLMQSVPKDNPDTLVINESTANGMAGGFYNAVMDSYIPNGTWDPELEAWVAPSGWVLLFIAWYEHEEYRKALVDGKLVNLDGIQFASNKEREDFLKDEAALREAINGHNTQAAKRRGVQLDGKAIAQLTDEQLNWRRQTIKADCKGDVKLFDQEYPESVDKAFMASGRPALNIAIVTRNLKVTRFSPPANIGNLEWTNTYKGPDGNQLKGPYIVNGVCRNRGELKVQWVDNPHGRWRIWKHPEPGYTHRYCGGFDVAEGLEQGDFDWGYFYDRVVQRDAVGEFIQAVASIQMHLSPEVYGEEMVKGGIYYENAHLGIERNPGGHGMSVIKYVFPMYSYLYFQEAFTRGYPETTDIVGWHTSEQSRKQMVDDLEEWTRKQLLRIPDIAFWTQARTFVYDAKGRPAAQGKKTDPGVRVYDDAIFGAGIGLQVHRWMPSAQPVKQEITGWRKRLKDKRTSGKGSMGV